jgi:hypothetical protein
VAVAVEPERKPLLFDSFGTKPSATFMPDLMHADITDPDLNQELKRGQTYPSRGNVENQKGHYQLIAFSRNWPVEARRRIMELHYLVSVESLLTRIQQGLGVAKSLAQH